MSGTRQSKDRVVVFFPDQGLFPDHCLRNLVASRRTFRALDTFLSHCERDLAHCTLDLPSHIRNGSPELKTLATTPPSLVDLIARLREGKLRHPAVLGSLCTVAQVGAAIHFFETDQSSPCQLLSQCKEGRDTKVTGSCTGLFSAAALAASSTVSQLVDRGREAVRLTFWVGIHSHQRAQDMHVAGWPPGLAQPNGNSKTATTAVPNGHSDTAITTMPNDNAKMGVTDSWMLYVEGRALSDLQNDIKEYTDRVPGRLVHVSATIATEQHTLNGPPLDLDALSQRLGTTNTRVPVWGLYHLPVNSQAFLDQMVESIIAKSRLADASVYEGQTTLSRVVLTHGTQTASSPSPPRMLQRLVQCVVAERLDWPSTIERVTDGANVTNVISFGPKSKLATLLLTEDAQPCDGRSSGETSTSRVDCHVGQERTTSPAETIVTSDVAIVGMSGRFPEANSVQELWDNVLAPGKTTHIEVPADRFDLSTHHDPTGKIKNSTLAKHGCFLDSSTVQNFDAKLFRVSPREAQQMDPQQRLSLLCTFEALEEAGYVPGRTVSTTKPRISTFIGQAGEDYREVCVAQDIDQYFIPGNIRAFIPGRLNHFFGWEGPSYSIDTACSASLAAIQLACAALSNREIDMAAAGGVSVLLNPDNFAGLSRGHFLSPTGGCKTFDQTADGYCRAEAVGIVILKRLEDALRDKDNVLGVIKASATNHSCDAHSIVHPDSATQERLCRLVCGRAGVDPGDVDYVESHGTGTQAGDSNEMKSTVNVFCKTDRGRLARRSQKPLYVSSVKANLGHSEAASGVVGLIKCLLMLQNNAIPPHVGIVTGINPALPDLNQANVTIPRSLLDWTHCDTGSPRRIILNNFSAAGGNTSVLLEEFPKCLPTLAGASTTEGPFVLPLSAHSQKSLRANVARLLEHLQTNEVPMKDLAYTLSVRRVHRTVRKAFVAASSDDFKRQLAAFITDDTSNNVAASVPEQVNRLGFLFTGQGTQFPGMGKHLFEHSAIFKEALESMQDAVTRLALPGAPNVVKYLIDKETTDIPSRLIVEQLGLFCFEVAMVRYWRSLLGSDYSSTVVGHSLGEYAALVEAGVMSLDQGLGLVGGRAQLMQELADTQRNAAISGIRAQSGMLVVGMAAADLPPLPGTVEVACLNSPTETVIGGPLDELDSMAALCKKRGLRATLISNPMAFHTSGVQSVVAKLRDTVGQMRTAAPQRRVTVVSSLFGRILSPTEVIDASSYFPDHARNPVRFVDAVEATYLDKAQSPDFWIEVGPSSTLLNLVRANRGSDIQGAASCSRSKDPGKILAVSVAKLFDAGLSIAFNELMTGDRHSLLSLPPYAFDLKPHMIKYTGDWCLHKESQGVTASRQAAGEQSLEAHPVDSRVSAFLKEQLPYDGTQGEVTYKTDLGQSPVAESIHGHRVLGHSVCPSSLYVELAIATTQDVYNTGREAGLAVGKMQVFRSLIAIAAGTTQPLWIRLKSVSSTESEVTFSTRSAQREIPHAQCSVFIEHTAAWLREWRRIDHLVGARIQSLQKDDTTNGANLIKKPLAYRLFKTMVDYDDSFQGMHRVWLNSRELEATAEVRIRKGGYLSLFDPHHVDSFGHLSGFVANCAAADEDHVFISNGWDRCRAALPLLSSKMIAQEGVFQTYVKMQYTSAAAEELSGDVYILDPEATTVDRIIGVFSGVKFKKMQRHLLQQILDGAARSTGSQHTKKAMIPGPKHRKTTATTPDKNPAGISVTHAAKRLSTTLSTPPVEHRVNGAIKSTDGTTWDTVWDAIITELGVEGDDSLSNDKDVAFADVGVDSLMTLAVLSRLREAHGLDLPPSMFLDNPTVGLLQSALNDLLPASVQAQAMTTGNKLNGIQETTSAHPRHQKSQSKPVETGGIHTFDAVLQAILDEVGLERDELANGDIPLADLGVDSLMSIAILSALSEQAQLHLSSSFFLDHPTMNHVKAALCPPEDPRKGEHSPMAAGSQHLGSSSNKPQPAKQGNEALPKVLKLQHGSSPLSHLIFLLPDGSGAAAAYVNLPTVSDAVTLYGINSPFLKSTDLWQHGVEQIANAYVDAIKATMQKDNCAGATISVGGWSFGGCAAFEVVRGLRQTGVIVTNLFLLDAPCPSVLPALPVEAIDWIRTSTNVFVKASSGSTSLGLDLSDVQHAPGLPQWLYDHFLATLRELEKYEPQIWGESVDESTAVHLLTAAGLVETSTDQMSSSLRDHPTVRWLLDGSTKVKDGLAWERLVGRPVKRTSIQANHFSMMTSAWADRLSELIRRALRS